MMIVMSMISVKTTRTGTFFYGGNLGGVSKAIFPPAGASYSIYEAPLSLNIASF